MKTRHLPVTAMALYAAHRYAVCTPLQCMTYLLDLRHRQHEALSVVLPFRAAQGEDHHLWESEREVGTLQYSTVHGRGVHYTALHSGQCALQP